MQLKASQNIYVYKFTWGKLLGSSQIHEETGKDSFTTMFSHVLNPKLNTATEKPGVYK